MIKTLAISVLLAGFAFSLPAAANQVNSGEGISTFNDKNEFFCSTPFGAIGVHSTDDKKVYYASGGNLNVNSFTPRLRFYVNTVEDDVACKQSLADSRKRPDQRLGFIFAQAFNYLDCTATELDCGTDSEREVAQVILRGDWRSPKGIPTIRKVVNFGPNQSSDWVSLLSAQGFPFETLHHYYENSVVKSLGFRSRFHGEIVDNGILEWGPITSSAETFTRWWVPADCKVNESTHCSHTVFLMRVTTSNTELVSSPTDFTISPWFTRKLLVTSWSPFNYEDNILRINLKND
ncbi:hypothetical protein [Maritalea sp.]|uniref:hypothetical protein n=1 Tax=Maritalea sp. TaxID=2003361 RepID=UPI003EF6E180